VDNVSRTTAAAAVGGAVAATPSTPARQSLSAWLQQRLLPRQVPTPSRSQPIRVTGGLAFFWRARGARGGDQAIPPHPYPQGCRTRVWVRILTTVGVWCVSQRTSRELQARIAGDGVFVRRARAAPIGRASWTRAPDYTVHLPPESHTDDIDGDVVGWTCGRYQEPSKSTKHDDRPRLPNVGAGLIALQRDGGGKSRSQLAAVADAASEVTNAVLVKASNYCHSSLSCFRIYSSTRSSTTCWARGFCQMCTFSRSNG